MIYITGDKHADFKDVFYFCYANKTTIKDTLIVLGDAGINYYTNEKHYEKLLYDVFKWGWLPQRFLFTNDVKQIIFLIF